MAKGVNNPYYKHGMSDTRLHKIWMKMRGRCYVVNNDHYKWYGARGITICNEWRDDFKAFYDWSMAHGYRDDLTIDRIDVNGNYCPENCRWVTMKEQCNNKRSNVYLEINGVTKNVRQWSEETGVKYATIYMRHKRGVPGIDLIKEVVST